MSTNPTPIRFDHERLRVYHLSLQFVRKVTPMMERIPSKLAVHGQLDRASTSTPLNIAEGNGRYTSADRCRFFDIARGSALECAAALGVAVAEGVLTDAGVDHGKSDLAHVVTRLGG